MPLRYSSLCTLLSDLESYANHDPPLLKTKVEEKSKKRISNWFTSYRLSSSSEDVDLVALLSALFPDRRKDRVYALKSRRLARSLKRSLHLGCGRWPLLDEWEKPGGGTLADCVERVLLQAEFPKQPVHREVTLEDVDKVLAAVAQKCRFSNPEIRAASEDERTINELLASIYRRLQSNEAKWFTRALMTEYPPLVLPEHLVFGIVDRRFADVMKIHDNFEAAVNAIKVGGITAGQDSLLRGPVAPARYVPKVGVKVGRPRFSQARSIKHGSQLARQRRMCIERKYDGEYCQVHVDLSKGERWVQIFSKSGKDSTRDRWKLHEPLRDALRVGQPDCPISSKCILEGEMVVWDDKTNTILEFCKIRKHVSRSGSFLGNKEDSPAHGHEHLMIIFFDVLMIDDEPILERPLFERRIHLERIIKPLAGRADLAERVTLDFGNSSALDGLRGYFAEAIAKRWEGLVMKPTDEAYFGSGPSGAWVKFKKDYIPGLGDTADLAIVGASYDRNSVVKSGLRNLKWTHFHLGCLFNLDEVLRGGKPYFAVIDVVSWGFKHEDLKTINDLGAFQAIDAASSTAKELFTYHVVPSLPRMMVVFKTPFVVEVMGGGFDKPSDSEWYALRWPRVLKIHQDRDWKDAVTLDQLQDMALEAMTIPIGSICEEAEAWSQKLNRVGRCSQHLLSPSEDTQGPQDGSSSSTASSHCLPLPLADTANRFPPTIVKHVRRPVKHITTAPMIRMDTNEMLPGDRRTFDGVVTMCPEPWEMECSLPGPSLSSPLKVTERSCKQADVHQDRNRSNEEQPPDNGWIQGPQAFPFGPAKAPSRDSLQQRANATRVTNEQRKRTAPCDHPSDENEDIMLGYVIRKTRIHMEDRRRELALREAQTTTTQTYLHERTKSAMMTPEDRLSRHADPPLEQLEKNHPNLTTAVGGQKRFNRTERLTPHSSSVANPVTVRDKSFQESNRPREPTRRVSATSDPESLISVIPETPQPSSQAMAFIDDAAGQTKTWACLIGESLSVEARDQVVTQLQSCHVSHVRFPDWNGYHAPECSKLDQIFRGRALILLVDGTANDPQAESPVNKDVNAFTHLLDQCKYGGGAIWDFRCLQGHDPLVGLNESYYLGQVELMVRKQVTVTWKDRRQESRCLWWSAEEGSTIHEVLR